MSEFLRNYHISLHKSIKKRKRRLIPVEYLVYECDRNAYFRYVNNQSIYGEYNTAEDLGRMFLYDNIIENTAFTKGFRNTVWEYGKVEGIVPEFTTDGVLFLKYLYNNNRFKQNLPYPHHIKLASFYKFLLENGQSVDGLDNVRVNEVNIAYIFIDNIANPVVKNVNLDELLPEQLIVMTFTERADDLWTAIQQGKPPKAIASWECGYCKYMKECIGAESND